MKKLIFLILSLVCFKLYSQDTIPATDITKLNYVGKWSISKDLQSSCQCAYTTDDSSFVEIIFKGTGIEVIGEKFNTHGTGSVFLNSDSLYTFNLYNQEMIKPYTFIEIKDLPFQTHVLKIKPVNKGDLILLREVKIYNNSNIETITEKYTFEKIIQVPKLIKLEAIIEKKIKIDTTIIEIDTIRYDTVGYYDFSSINIEAFLLDEFTLSVSVNEPSIIYYLISDKNLGMLDNIEPENRDILIHLYNNNNYGKGTIGGIIPIEGINTFWNIKLSKEPINHLYLVAQNNKSISNLLKIK